MRPEPPVDAFVGCAGLGVRPRDLPELDRLAAGLDHRELKFRSGPRDIKLVEESEARVVRELLA